VAHPEAVHPAAQVSDDDIAVLARDAERYSQLRGTPRHKDILSQNGYGQYCCAEHYFRFALPRVTPGTQTHF
jgi:hypothetical protein